VRPVSQLWQLSTPYQRRTVAKDLRRQVNDPEAQELTIAHEKPAMAKRSVDFCGYWQRHLV
jgi:hypothetical protein